MSVFQKMNSDFLFHLLLKINVCAETLNTGNVVLLNVIIESLI